MKLGKDSRKFSAADYGNLAVAKLAALKFQEVASCLEMQFEVRKGNATCSPLPLKLILWLA